MILFTLIKKEITHFFRKKSNVATMLIFPIVLILVMGFSLNGIMNAEVNIFENEKVYYKIDKVTNEDIYLQIFNGFKENCKDNINIEFEEVKNDTIAKEKVNKSQALAFISISKDKYDFYRNPKKESQSQKIFRSIFEQYLEKYTVMYTVSSINSNIKLSSNEENKVKVKEEGISNSGIDSFTYYTFAELVLIILYISHISSTSTHNEKSQRTLYRLKVSTASNFSIIASKIILGLIVGILQIIVVYFVSTVFLDISWGKNIASMIIVLISLIVFSSVLGVTISLIFKDNKSASSLINTILIILGFLGGAYVPISLIKSIKITNILCQMTPTYWANISLLSLSSGISTNYTYISIALSLGLSIILLGVGIIFTKRRVGDNNA